MNDTDEQQVINSLIKKELPNEKTNTEFVKFVKGFDDSKANIFTENEKTFSVYLSGNIAFKIRNRLSDEVINTLVFWIAYFMRIRQDK